MLKRQTDFLHRSDLRVDDPECHVEAQPLLHDRRAITTVIIGIGKIDVPSFLKTIPLLFSKEGLGQTLGISGRKRRVIFPNRQQLAETPPSGRVGGGKVDVRAFILAAELEVLVNVI